MRVALAVNALNLAVHAQYQPYFGEEAVRRARSRDTVMRLHMMPDEGLRGRGAVCLDGSDAGFYFAPASDLKSVNDWQIFFRSGGWCYDEMDCWARSKGKLGSSKKWSETVAQGGIMSDNCHSNPDFCNANRVQLPYCDGNSFSGDRSEPVVVIGLDGKQKSLFFRGKRILDAVLSTLLTMGLDKAQNVLLTGFSAGGLATFLHADYVHNFLKSAGVPIRRFKAAPESGFFLPHQTVEGKPVYPMQMKNIFALANSTGGVNAKCVAAMNEGDAWMCNFAQYAYMYTESPIFPINSALDSWQTSCIYTSKLVPRFPEKKSAVQLKCGAVAGYGTCQKYVEACTKDQMITMNTYITDFNQIMLAVGTYSKDGNGAFIHSCHSHGAAMQSSAWNGIKVGGLTMQQAFSKWWHSKDEPAAEHSRTPCLYHTETLPRRCNPTCRTVRKPRRLRGREQQRSDVRAGRRRRRRRTMTTTMNAVARLELHQAPRQG